MASILITGANSGLGFETAFQLASKHANATIILGCRSLEKADQAAKDLRKRLGEDNKTKFVSFAVDVSDIEVSKKSATELLERKSEFGGKLTHLVLNAGLLTNSLERTKQGYELMVAASLFGHHVIVSKWLEAGLIADDASIVISGSEATTNVFPATAIGFSVPDFHKLAKERGFSLEELLTDLAKNSINEKQFVQEPQYAFAKCYVSWWSSSLARRYPSLTVTTVSPGMTPNTAIARSAPWYLTLVIMFVNWVGVFFGNSS